MIRHLGAASAAVLALAAFAPAHAGVTFGSAKAITNASADTDYGQARYGQGFGTDSDSTTDYTQGVDVTAGAQANTYQKRGPGVDSGNALEESSASFTSASSGVLDTSGVTSATTYGAGETADAYSEGQSVQYTFTVDAASVINLSFLLGESYSAPYYYTQLYLGAPDLSSQVYNANLGSNTSGAMSFNLAAGTYLLSLYTQEGDYAYAADGASSFGSHEEKVTFDISAAPEPGTWALMTLGVGLAGAALRRRRAAGALAA